VISLTRSQIETLLDGLAVLARVFWGPSRELVEAFRDSDLEAELRVMADLVQAPSDVVLAPPADAKPDDWLDRLETEYVRLFVSEHGGVPAPPYHSYYFGSDRLLMRRPARDMARRLAEAGLDMGEISEPPDHVAVEIEYLFYLVESVYAGDRDELASDLGAFAAEMAEWLPQFVQRLETHDASSFYLNAARLLTAAVNQLAEPT
jgi:TorA maturation chaperone TorD